nr:twin transmembrane helix small protein [Mesorhizobium soli]
MSRSDRNEAGYLMSTVFNIFAIIVMFAVVVVLLRGLVNMMRGGSGNTSNKLMQMRVLLQFIALVLILLALYFHGR